MGIFKHLIYRQLVPRIAPSLRQIVKSAPMIGWPLVNTEHPCLLCSESCLRQPTHLLTKLPCASYFGVTKRWEGMTFFRSSDVSGVSDSRFHSAPRRPKPPVVCCAHVEHRMIPVSGLVPPSMCSSYAKSTGEPDSLPNKTAPSPCLPLRLMVVSFPPAASSTVHQRHKVEVKICSPLYNVSHFTE